MVILVYKVDKMYGGKEYVEFDTELGVYKTGDTRAHKGHYNKSIIEIEVNTNRELNEYERQLIAKGIKEDMKFYE